MQRRAGCADDATQSKHCASHVFVFSISRLYSVKCVTNSFFVGCAHMHLIPLTFEYLKTRFVDSLHPLVKELASSLALTDFNALK